MTECYVPIEFSPPPNDTRGVTQEDLVGGLRSIFMASPRFAGDVLDMVQDRLELEDSSTTVKCDVLQTLAVSLPSYCSSEDTATTEAWMVKSLQRVSQLTIDCILGGGEDSIVEAALSVVHALAGQITVCPTVTPYFRGCLTVFVQEAVGDAETFRASLSVRALVAIASASSYAFESAIDAFSLQQGCFLATNLPERKML